MQEKKEIDIQQSVSQLVKSKGKEMKEKLKDNYVQWKEEEKKVINNGSVSVPSGPGPTVLN